MFNSRTPGGRRILALIASTVVFLTQAQCSGNRPVAANEAVNLKSGLAAINAEDLLRHIQTLASDEFEGRASGTRGEALTVEYLIVQFKKLGLSPGNPDGTYVQNVSILAIKGKPSAAFVVGNRRLCLNYPRDYVAVSRHNKPEIEMDGSEMVFVGYGTVAPEYGWDDYKDVDVGGKTLVMLINDPPVRDRSDPSKLDTAVFEGRAMSYYGRWTYKYEIAAEKKAAAAILVHETGDAGYPYGVVVRSWGDENLTVEENGSRDSRVPVEGWITRETAERLFSLAGKDFQKLKKAAASRSFRPVSLGAGAQISYTGKDRHGVRNITVNFDRPPSFPGYVRLTDCGQTI